MRAEGYTHSTAEEECKGGTSHNEYALRREIPYLNIGYIQDIACWGPFVIPFQTSCALCQNKIANHQPDEEVAAWVRLINEKLQPPSNSFVNTIAATLGVLDVVSRP